MGGPQVETQLPKKRRGGSIISITSWFEGRPFSVGATGAGEQLSFSSKIGKRNELDTDSVEIARGRVICGDSENDMRWPLACVPGLRRLV